MVPEGWEVKELDALCKKIAVGLAISVTPHMRNEGVKLIRNQNIKRNYFNDRSVIYIDPEFAEANRSKKVKPGDIVAVRTGSNIGEACVVPAEFDGALTFTTLIARPDPKLLDSFFLSTHINSDRGVAEVNRLCAGGGKPNLNSGELKRYRLLAPPLPEQKKIAQILTTWDKAITTTEQLLANSQQQKKALMQQLLTGKKRLLNKNGVRFSGEWRFLTFDEAFKVANKKSAQVKSSDYLATGSVPVVDQGKELIAGYCDNDERYTNVPVIIFGDHTRCLKWVDFEFCPGADGTQVLDSKEFLDKKFGYYLLCHTDIPNLGYSRHMRELKEKDFKVPVDMIEQQKIAAVLSTTDQEISALQKKLDALKQEKKALMQQLLTGKRRVTLR